RVDTRKDNGLMTFKPEDQIQSLNNDSKEIKLIKGKKRHPCGQLSLKNKLNTLTGREWYLFTKSWLIHRPPSRTKDEILHPAKFPETLIRKFITFFTKPGEIVLDPFLGTGSTLVAAKQTNRIGIGFELSEEYACISSKRVEAIQSLPYPPIYQTENKNYWKVLCHDSRELKDIWDKQRFPPTDFCITSPPYWNQLKRNSIRQKDRKEKGLATQYSEDNRDLGNIKSYQKFLKEQKYVFGQVFEVLKNKGYLVVITNNVFTDGQIYPLAFDTATSLSRDLDHNWVLKDEKIWLQDDKSLIAFGVNNAWVANRCHQYCLIFRKEVTAND
ncbi:MAG: DNA methyltransferase, partial [Candidatus Hodarchaeales archaeon]